MYGSDLPEERDRHLIARAGMEDAAVNNEPLYLLLSYIRLIPFEESFGPLDSLARWLGQTNRCLGALRQEVREMSLTMDSLAALLEVASVGPTTYVE